MSNTPDPVWDNVKKEQDKADREKKEKKVEEFRTLLNKYKQAILTGSAQKGIRNHIIDKYEQELA